MPTNEPQETADKFRAMMDAEDLLDQPYAELWDKHQETLAELHEANRLARQFANAYQYTLSRKEYYKAAAMAAMYEIDNLKEGN